MIPQSHRLGQGVPSQEFDQLGSLAAGLLTARELWGARKEVEALTGLGSPVRVPCHRDYTPRNWLVGARGLYVVDFEWSRPDVWISDLARLHLGIWENRPDLCDAFLRGYGRAFDDTDHAILQGCAVLTALWCLIKARENGQPSFEEGSRAALQRLLAV
jgi:thiamine kinase-like enzyme